MKFFKTITKLPLYFKDRFYFIRKMKSADMPKGWKQGFYPVLFEKNAEAASLGEYFWQDLFVAKKIIELNPKRHIDIGSRIDGFIAHLALLRKVEIFDIRPLTAKIENVSFVQWDITNPDMNYSEIADCVTCLHTIEHIGLGRYGDEIDPDGWKKGMRSLSSVLASGGHLYMSVPIGVQRIEFNAHRIFDPKTIIKAGSEFGLDLQNFWYLSETGFSGALNVEEEVERLSKLKYGLGVFLFKKLQK